MKAIDFCLLVFVILVFSACQKESNDPYGQFVGKWNVLHKATVKSTSDLGNTIQERHYIFHYQYEMAYNRQYTVIDSIGDAKQGVWGYVPEDSLIILLVNYVNLPDGALPYTSTNGKYVLSVDANSQHWQTSYIDEGTHNLGDQYVTEYVENYYLTRQ